MLENLGSQLKDKAHRVSTFHHTVTEPRAAGDLLAEVLLQLTASCYLSAACSALSQMAGAPAVDWQRLARSAYSLLHGGGLELLKFSVKCLASFRAGAPAGASTVPMLLAQLHAAAAFARGMPLGQQLEAGLLQPAQLRAWLAAAVQLLQLLRQSGEPGWVQQPMLLVLPELAADLYSCIEMEPHWGATRDGSTELRLVQLLMPAVSALPVALRLPAERRPQGCSWEVAANLFGALNLAPLQLGVTAWALSTDSRGLLGVLCGTAQLLAMMELEQPAASGAPSVAGSAAGSSSAPAGEGLVWPGSDPRFELALDALLVLKYAARLAAERIQQQTAPQQQRATRDLHAAVARLPSLAALVACWWSFVSAHGGEPEQRTAMQVQAAFVECWDSVVSLLLSYTTLACMEANQSSDSPQLASSFDDAAARCSAASAALRSIPLLLQFEQPATSLIHSLVELAAWAGVAAYQLASDSVDEAGELPAAVTANAAALVKALWDLHTRAVRLVHLAAAGGCGAALQLTARESVLALLGALSDSMTAAGVLFEHAGNAEMDQWRRQLEAMAVAHLPAMHVLADAVNLADLDQRASRMSAASGLSWAVATGPLALATSPILQALLQQLLESPLATPAECECIFRIVAAAPLAVVCLWLSGQMKRVLEQAAQHCSEPEAEALAQAAMKALCGASAAARSLGVSSLKFADDMEDICILLEEGAPGAAHMALHQLATEVLPQAAELATVVQQLTPAPEAAQLQLAQAAAVRSCAYLCCANLGGEGGPAAGQGVGSQRCSACRAVWYCGTACSHADWREGGHRRVCKALGAARAAEKEQRRQAAAGGSEL